MAQPFAPWLTLDLQGLPDSVTTSVHPTTGSRTWTPLVPPGHATLGPTTLPQGPSLPATFPGSTVEPIQPQIEILPGEDFEEINARIPGFGAGAELPSPGLVFANEPAKPLEVGRYKDLRRRSINDEMDVDHIVSRKALEIHILKLNSNLTIRERKNLLEMAPSVVIPAIVHRRFSETYGGRNTKAKQVEDAADIKGAVNSNVDALKPGLLEYGFSEVEVEMVRQQLHELHKFVGWYE